MKIQKYESNSTFINDMEIKQTEHFIKLAKITKRTISNFSRTISTVQQINNLDYIYKLQLEQ